MSTARFVTSISAAVVLATVTSTASAQTAAGGAKGLGQKHQLIVAADRLMPLFAYESSSVDEQIPNGTRTTTTSGASSSFLFGSSLSRLTPHTVPRAGFDFTVIDRLTLGGFVALGFGYGGSRKVETVTNNVRTETSLDTGSGTVFGVGPRVGYILPLGEYVAFWPRGGVSFYSLNTKADDVNNNGIRRTVSATDTTFAIDLEPQLAITPLEHFFFTVGGVIDIPVAGSSSTTVSGGNTTVTTSDDLRNFHLGLTAGLGGWFDL